MVFLQWKICCSGEFLPMTVQGRLIGMLLVLTALFMGCSDDDLLRLQGSW